MKKELLITALLGALLFSGCAKSAAAQTTEVPAGGYEGAGTAEVEYSANDVSAETGYYEAEKTETEPTELNEPDEPADPVQFQEKLVYRGNLTLETLTYEETLQNIRQHISKYNGMIEYENEPDQNYGWYTDNYRPQRRLSLTVRIPTESYGDFLADMEGTGKVISRSSDIENISRKYNDTSVRIEALKKQEERLLDMMSKAATIEEMILVETRLTEVQTDLNLLQSQMSQMNTDIAYSTVTISLTEVVEYTKYDPSFTERIADAFADGWNGFLDLTEGVIILVLTVWPLILILAAVFLFARHIFRKRKDRKEAAETEKEIL